jgi:hypothetical protein
VNGVVVDGDDCTRFAPDTVTNNNLIVFVSEYHNAAS